MMYVDPTSQYKFVAKSTPHVATSETTGSNIANDIATVSAAENIAPSTIQAPPNDATHFQAPEHAQKQATLAQNAAGTAVPMSPSQVAPPVGQVNVGQGQAAGAAGVPGQGLTYDGKRMRKTMQRRTVDYNSSVIRFLETRKWFKSSRNQLALQPQEIYNVDVVPPCGYIKNPMNSVTTKFVRTSTNKLRCPIFCVVWTPEGRRLVTGASSGEFTLWNGLTFNFETILQTWAYIRKSELDINMSLKATNILNSLLASTKRISYIHRAHDRAVRSMVWSHNDLWLLTADHGGFVKYWQSNMNNVKMYEAHKEPVRGLSFSPSDNKFASCSDDGLVKIWDFYRCAEERQLKGHGADVKCVDWHPSKGILVSGSKDSQQPVKLWDPKSGNSITTLHCHKSTVMAAKWNSNGNWLLTGSRDHLLKLFDIRMMKELQTFRGHKKEATVVAWHPVHETLFASGGSDGSLMFWLTGVDEKAGGMEKAHEGIVWSLSWHPLGHILCSGSNDHTSKFWARNRPGDAMTDKYNLDIQGSQEEGDCSEEGTSQTSVPALAAYDATQVIPGVGLPVTASNVVLPDSKDVDAHLYGEGSKDNRKIAVTKPSATASSEFPYPPAFKQSTQSLFENRPGNFSQHIPGLDMSITDVQVKQENEGYKIPRLPGPPKLRLPTHLPTPQSNPGNHLPQGNHPPTGNRPPPGNRPPLASHPGNRPPFGPGPRYGFDYRGPPGPRGPDPNFRPSGQFQPNQYMRFPGPQGPGGSRGSYGPQKGPGGPHPEPWGAPHHLGPRGGPFDPYRPPDGQHGGPRPQNIPPDHFGHRGGLQEGPRPHGGPIGVYVRPDGQHGGPRPQNIPTSQHGLGDGSQGGPRGPSTDPNVHPDSQPGGPRLPLNMPPGLQGGPRSRRLPSDHNARSEDPNPFHKHGPRDGLQDGSHDGPAGEHEARHGRPKPTDVPPVQHGTRDGPPGSNVRSDDPYVSSRPPLNVSSSPHEPRDSSHGPRPGSTGPSTGQDSPHGGPCGHDIDFSQHGPRDGSQRPRGPPTGPNIHPSGSHGSPRPPLNIPPGLHGPRDSPNFGPRTVNDNGHPFGPSGPRPPQFQQPRSDQPKPELKSPESEKRGENVQRRSRDSSPGNSPPVSASNHVKRERRTSDPEAPGILGDYQTHMKEIHRGMLENLASSAVGRLFGQAKPDIARQDRPPHGRQDTDRHHGPDTGRSTTRDRNKSEGDRRGDRPPFEPHDRPDMTHPGQRPPRDRPGDHDRDRPPSDRPDMGRREDRPPHDRPDIGRPRDRPSLEGRPRDRPPRGSPKERSDMGQPGGRPPFDRQDSGRQSDRSFADEKNAPAHEKPGLLPIPDMFLARGPLPNDGPPRDPGSADHRPPDRRRDHGRFQDGRNDIRPDNPGFGRGPRDHPPEMRQGKAQSGGGHNDGPPAAGETNLKPLMSLLDAPPVSLGSPPGQGGVESRGRKRSMEHEFDRPPKRIGTSDNRERLR